MDQRREIATKVRVRAEQYQREHLDLPFGKNLREMCAICAIALARSFLTAGYFARPFFGRFRVKENQISGQPHCWVMVQTATFDETIIERWDITATQFGKQFDPVVRHVGEDCFHYEEVCELPGFSDETFWAKWPKHQRPTEDVLSAIILEFAESS